MFMKNLIVITFLALMLISSLNASAGLFGASNFEECMSDGKVGRTNAELYLLKKNCQRKFPKLPKQYAMKDATILCVSSDKSEQDTYQIYKNNLISETGKKYQLNLRTEESIVLKAHWVEHYITKKPLPTTFKIETLSGAATIEVFETNELINPTFSYSCTEK